MMEWEKQEHEQQHQQNGNGSANGGMIYVKVMTDEQLETLRKQIAVYASICEQLVEMHKNLTTQQDLAGARMGNIYCDPFMASSGHKITARQRWTPTPIQLQILERIFNQGTGTPDKQKIKEITAELSQHGQISESNVYNWFQNRRARSKRKQMVAASSNNAESEVETEVDSPKDKKTKPECLFSQQSSARRPEDMCFQAHEMNTEMQYLDQQSNKLETTFPAEDGVKPSRSLGQTSLYDAMLSNPRADHLMGKMEATGSYGFYDQAEDYGMAG